MLRYCRFRSIEKNLFKKGNICLSIVSGDRDCSSSIKVEQLDGRLWILGSVFFEQQQEPIEYSHSMSHEELFLWEKGKEREGNRRADGTWSGWGRELHTGKDWMFIRKEDWILNVEIKGIIDQNKKAMAIG